MKPFSAWLQKHPAWTVVIPITFALGARLAGISTRPLWYDEAFAVLSGQKSGANSGAIVKSRFLLDCMAAGKTANMDFGLARQAVPAEKN